MKYQLYIYIPSKVGERKLRISWGGGGHKNLPMYKEIKVHLYI